MEHEICPANKSQITISNSFLLNIAEHENFSANKYVVGIIIFISRENIIQPLGLIYILQSNDLPCASAIQGGYVTWCFWKGAVIIFTILPLWVLGLARSRIHASQTQTVHPALDSW